MADMNEMAAQLQKESASLKSVPIPVGSYVPFNTAELAVDMMEDNVHYDLFFDA